MEAQAPTRATPSEAPFRHRTAATSSPTETARCEAPTPGARIHACIVHLGSPSEVMYAAWQVVDRITQT